MEDFTTYTEVDPGSDIVVTSTDISVTTMAGNVDASVYKDFWAGGLNEFVHDFSFVVDVCDYPLVPMIWAISDVAEASAVDLSVGSAEWFYVVIKTGSLYITGKGFTATSSDTVILGAEYIGVTVYATVRRISTTIRCDLYSDEGRQNLIGSIFGTNTGSAYRYLNAFGSPNTGAAGSLTLTISNLVRKSARKPTQPVFIY